MKPWMIAIRPKTLMASFAPILVGSTLALSEGHFSPTLISLILITALSIQIGTNLTNDYFDFIKGVDNENRKGTVKVLQKGWMTLQTMRKGIIATFAVSLIGSGYLIAQGGYPIAIIAAFSIFFAITYTAGPWPLGHLGLADPIEFIFFGPIAVSGTYYLLTQTLSLPVVLAGCIPGFLSLAILSIDNLRDYETDQSAGKKTLCVRFGKNFGKFEYYFCIFMGFVTPILLIALTKSHLFSLIAFLVLPLYKKCLDTVRDDNSKEALNQALAQTAMNLLLFTLLFSAGWLL